MAKSIYIYHENINCVDTHDILIWWRRQIRNIIFRK